MLRNWKFEIQIDTKSNQAVYLQIADAIIKDIQSGRLQPGDPLPGSRNLAQLLKVNRNWRRKPEKSLTTTSFIRNKGAKKYLVNHKNTELVLD